MTHDPHRSHTGRFAALALAAVLAACSRENSPRPAPGEAPTDFPAALVDTRRGAPPVERRPDVLIVVLDSLRADRVGLLGDDRDLTPNIDGVLRSGARALLSYAPSPHTAPSLATLLTGMAPAAHGVRNVDQGGVWQLDRTRASLTEILDRAGYQTFFLNEGGQVRRENGFDRGVDVWVASNDLSGTIESLGKLLPNAKRDEPVFCIVHSHAAHAPFLPPREQDSVAFRGRFTDREGGGEFRTRTEALEAFAGNRRGKEYADLAQGFLAPYEGSTSDDAAWLADLYDENVAFLDHQFGLLLEIWNAERGAGEAIVVLTSGHGIALGEDGVFGAPAGLGGAATRVPWSIGGPGVAPGVLTAAIGTANTAASILELLDLPAPATMAPSLGSALASRGEREVVGVFEQQSPSADEWALGRMRYHLVVRGDANSTDQRLFDLLRDPQMLTPVEEPEIATKLRVELEKSRAEALGLLGAAPARQVPLDPKTRQKLRVLGYLTAR